jgi:glyoxylase-like metal-dependent hydrolase (beta-lactamase superfamily II)
VKKLADDVWQVRGFPPNAINVYVIGDVLIDASTRYATRRIMRQVADHGIAAHALTHAHPDHQGASHNVCERLGIPFWVGAADADAAERPELIGERQPDHFMAQFFAKTCTGPGHPVDRRLVEGDEVAGFEVIEVPGHSIGHVAFWRQADGVLVLGDVVNTADPYTGIPGLREPKPYFTPDPAENRRSAKKLGPLEPKLVLAGHGPPLRETRKFVEFVAALPAD